MSIRRIIQQTRLLLAQGLYESRRALSSTDETLLRPLDVAQLEERILMSASPLAAAASAPDAAAATDAAALTDGQLLDVVADSLLPQQETAAEKDAAAADAAPQTAPTVDSDSVEQTAAEHTLELVFLDSAVSDLEQMLADLRAASALDDNRTLEVVVLDGQQNGIAQITSSLMQFGRVDAIHIVSHGSDGQVQLGSTLLSKDNLETYRPAVSAWQHSLSDNADLLFYGCDLTATADGQELMNQLAAACGCDVAAGEDLPGHIALDGDWGPESASGQLESQVAVRHELVILDPGVQNSDELRELLLAQQEEGRELEFFVLDANRDGIEQIAEILAQFDDLDAVHVLSHGTSQGLQLGSTWLDAQKIEDYSEVIRGWRGAFGSDADLLFYGCDLANSGEGRELVRTLGVWTGTDVAASVDATGFAGFGGDWDLEFKAGSIEAAVVADADVQRQWVGLMAVSVDSVSTGTTTGSSVTFSHATSGANRLMLVGISFGQDDGDSVSSVTYNGANLTLVGARDHNDSALARAEIWSLVAPDTGTHNVVVNMSGSSHQGATIGVMTFNGVDQATALGSFGFAQGNSTNAAASIASAAGELVFGVVGVNEGNDYNLVPGGGQAEQWDLYSGTANGGGSTASGAASVLTSWTIPDAKEWVVGGVSIKAASASVVDTGAAIWSDTSTKPQTSTWDGSSFGTTADTATLPDNYRIIQGADAPTRNEKIVVGVDASGNVTGEIWNGSNWSALPLSMGSVSETYWWGADVSYEQTSGDAIVVWNDNSQAAGQKLRFAVWNGSSWSGPQSIAAYTGAEPQHLKLAFDPGSDTMALVVDDVNADDYVLIWNGSSWGNAVSLDTSGTAESDQSAIAVAFEAQSGHAMVTYGKNNDSAVYYRTWNGTVWGAEASVTAPGTVTGDAKWLVSATDMNSNRIVLGATTSGNEAWLSVWNGSTWETALQVETGTTGGTYPNLAVAFESTSGQALATYGEGTQSLFRYRTWESGTGWSAEQTGSSLDAVPNSMFLDSAPSSDGIMLSVQDADNDLYYSLWNGSAWEAANKLSTNTGEVKNQPFAFVWDQSGSLVGSSAPSITGLAGDSLNYTPASGAAVIDQDGNTTVTDNDSADFATGTLTVSFASGSDSSEDVLAIRNQGSGAGQIGVSGANVTYSGTTIGTWAGGTSGSNLVVTLNANANGTNIAALIQNITYENTDLVSPTAGIRTVRFVLTDGDGGTSANVDTTVTVASSEITLTQRVSAASDDAEEEGPTGTTPGRMVLNSTDIELVSDYEPDTSGDQKVGLRFTGMNIPVGATITDAYLVFRAIPADSGMTNNDPVSLTLQGQLTGNAATFTTTSGDISGRTLTSASTAWSPTAWTTGSDYNSPDISSVVQEIVDQGTWASGNALAIIITGAGHRASPSYDGDPSNAAQLVVTYTSPPDITSDLVMHLTLDDGSGSTAVDETANNNDGNLIGGTSWTSSQIGGGLAFDYTDGEDYIEVPNSATLENVQEGDYALSGWFRPDSTPPGTGSDNDANYGIIIKTGWNTGLSFTSDNQFAFEHILNGDIGVGVKSTSTFTPGEFYHVAGVVDRAAGTLSLYVDGQLEGVTSFTPGAAAREYGTETWKIGIASPGASVWGWAADGAIDDARIYGRALNLSEVQLLASMGSSPPVVNLPGGPLNYTENDPATLIDATATVTDSDSPDFDTGTLTVNFTANGTASDRLAIRNQGTGAGQIGISGSSVTYEGTTIGSFTGGGGRIDAAGHHIQRQCFTSGRSGFDAERNLCKRF